MKTCSFLNMKKLRKPISQINKLNSMRLQLIVLISIFVVPKMLYGQVERVSVSPYVWFDRMIGQTNSGIFKGITYSNEYRVINERHQFFSTSDFVMGSVVYRGQPFFGIPLKYDVYSDRLLVQNSTLADTPVMIFDQGAIESFNIGEHNFKRIHAASVMGAELSGYFEVLLKNESLTLYKEHTKKPFKRTDEQVVYYEFKNGHSYYLSYGDRYHKLKKTNQLNSLFPSFRKEIKTIRDQYESLRKSEPDTFLISILIELSELIAKEGGLK